jgi:uncharacterized protein YaaW (UPF0174 family)
VDELRAALELATDEELSGLTDLLFCPKFNPLDYLQQPEVLALRAGDRSRWLDDLEQRFRFLAADGLTVLQRKTDRLSYRMILIQVCCYLKLPYSSALSTMDLEAEIFLVLVQRSGLELPSNASGAVGTALKGGGAMAASTLVTPLVRRLAGQTLAQQGLVAAARQGLLRYGVVRSAALMLGPVMWTWFLADLGWRSISTNYGRIIPMVFALAQIRLTRGFD